MEEEEEIKKREEEQKRAKEQLSKELEMEQRHWEQGRTLKRDLERQKLVGALNAKVVSPLGGRKRQEGKEQGSYQACDTADEGRRSKRRKYALIPMP